MDFKNMKARKVSAFQYDDIHEVLTSRHRLRSSLTPTLRNCLPLKWYARRR